MVVMNTKMDTIGTKEARDLIYMNDSIRIGNIVCKVCDGGYMVLENGVEILSTSKINIALDYLVSIGVLYETRFRLTAEQKDALRENIWDHIGCAIMGASILGTSVIMIVAWLCGL